MPRIRLAFPDEVDLNWIMRNAYIEFTPDGGHDMLMLRNPQTRRGILDQMGLPLPAPKKEAKPVKAQPQPPISSEWTNVLQHFVIDELRALHESLFDSKGGAKNKQQLVDAVCSHSSGIDILKKQSVYVKQLRDVLVQKASLSEQEAKALSKEDIIEKLRRGELRVPAPAPSCRTPRGS